MLYKSSPNIYIKNTRTYTLGKYTTKYYLDYKSIYLHLKEPVCILNVSVHSFKNDFVCHYVKVGIST